MFKTVSQRRSYCQHRDISFNRLAFRAAVASLVALLSVTYKHNVFGSRVAYTTGVMQENSHFW
jgi:hypothetical protein